MFTLKVDTEKGKYIHVVYSVYDFPYKTALPDTLEFITRKGQKKDPPAENFFITFDIETTSYRFSPAPNDCTGFMYHWQAATWKKSENGKWQANVVFGRTWEEFQIFHQSIKDTFREKAPAGVYTAWVHNLAFETAFMWRFLEKPFEMFSRDNHDVVRNRENNIVEWRCSYALTNMTLAKACENARGVTHYKKTGDLDYRKVRTCNTPMTETELGYCFNDVYGLGEVVIDKLQEHTFLNMPYTSTGYVRRDCRYSVKGDKKYRAMFKKTKPDVEQYKYMRGAFAGGDTHANRRYVGKVIREKMMGVDFTSAYPGVIMRKMFPTGKPMWLNWDDEHQPDPEEMEHVFSESCVIMDVTFLDPVTDHPAPYISLSHCTEFAEIPGKPINDNGRLLQALYCRMIITEVDLEIILREYKVSGFLIHGAFAMKKSLLPDPIRKTTLKYFELKTTLDGIPGKEYEYLKSKGKLNAIYGMMATVIDHPDWQFEEGVWTGEKQDTEEALNKYYDSKTSFLPYQWALYVTAHVRNELHKVIDCTCVNGVYYHVYNDTDSVKFVYKPEILKNIEEYNKTVLEENAACGMPCSQTRPDGKVKTLGVAADDGTYTAFRTWGAKKYYTIEEGGKEKLTLAGVNKKSGLKFLQQNGGIDAFDLGLVFPVEYSGRTTSTFLNDDIHKLTINGDTFTTAGGICIEDTTYTLGLTASYLDVLGLNELWED